MKAASDRPTVDALLFLPVPGDAGTVSFDKSIALDTEPPYVRSVAVTTGDGVYGTGDTIGLVCVFSQPVVVVGEDDGTPSVGLSLGRSDRSARAVYSGGNGTAEFELSYTVRAVCAVHGWEGSAMDVFCRVLFPLRGRNAAHQAFFFSLGG